MGRLKIKVAECYYKENVMCLKEQFINGSNDDIMASELIKELMAVMNTSDITGDVVLTWAKTVQAQRSQTIMLENVK